MTFSRFTHRFDRTAPGVGEVTAFYHSLRMLPVYMPREQAEEVAGYVTGDDAAPLPAALAPAFKRLCDAQVICPDAAFDDRVLARVREEVKGPAITIAYFILTEDCNFNCTYCYVKGETPAGHRPLTMSRATARRAVAAYARLLDRTGGGGPRMIIFYGGEPLLNFDALEEAVLQVEEYQADGRLPGDLRLMIITNGSLLTPEAAGFLAAHAVQAAVSLDGSEAAHDACRVFPGGGRTYRAALAGFHTARERGCEVSLSVTLSEKSLEDFEDTLDTIERLGCKEFGFNMMTVEGPREMALVERTTRAIIRAYERFAPRGVLEDRIMRKVAAFNSAAIYYFDCAAAGARQITISPEGGVGLCHVQVGSRTDFVATVEDAASGRFDPARDPVFLEWSRRTPVNMPQCQGCAALGICGGGCPYNARLKRGGIWELDERFCAHARMILDYLIWDLFSRMVSKSTILGGY